MTTWHSSDTWVRTRSDLTPDPNEAQESSNGPRRTSRRAPFGSLAWAVVVLLTRATYPEGVGAVPPVALEPPEIVAPEDVEVEA